MKTFNFSQSIHSRYETNLCFHVVLIWRLSSSFDSLIALLEWKLSLVTRNTWKSLSTIFLTSTRCALIIKTNKQKRVCIAHMFSWLNFFDFHTLWFLFHVQNIMNNISSETKIKEHKIKRLQRLKCEGKRLRRRLDGRSLTCRLIGLTSS